MVINIFHLDTISSEVIYTYHCETLSPSDMFKDELRVVAVIEFGIEGTS